MRIKRGQVSIFVILAILIVVIIALYFLLRNNAIFGKERISPEIAPIYSFAENCVKETAQDAIYYVASTGGYFSLPDEATDSHIAYYLYDGKNLMPSKERVETELSSFMSEMLFFCLDNFENFPDFEIEQEDVNAKTKIINDYVIFNVEYPLTIKKGGNSYNIKKFSSEIPVGFYKAYESAYEIMQEQMNHKKDICINCIYEIAEKNDLYIDMFDYKENQVVFIITDPNSKINEKEFELQFANFYYSHHKGYDF